MHRSKKPRHIAELINESLGTNYKEPCITKQNCLALSEPKTKRMKSQDKTQAKIKAGLHESQSTAHIKVPVTELHRLREVERENKDVRMQLISAYGETQAALEQLQAEREKYTKVKYDLGMLKLWETNALNDLAELSNRRHDLEKQLQAEQQEVKRLKELVFEITDKLREATKND
jgi:vacuolar-type H+-ATPase subunit I/STV1